MRWQIYYDHGGVVKDLSLELIQDEGVICILQERVDNRHHIIYGTDYYIFDGKFWLPVQLNGLEDYVVKKLSVVKRVLKGRTVNNELFRNIYERAKKDMNNVRVKMD